LASATGSTSESPIVVPQLTALGVNCEATVSFGQSELSHTLCHDILGQHWL